MRLGPRGGGSACVLLELGRCLGPCTGAVAQERYAALVATLEAALDGDPEPAPAADPEEVAEWRWVPWEAFRAVAATAPWALSPWAVEQVAQLPA